jgi:hypothetical protein
VQHAVVAGFDLAPFWRCAQLLRDRDGVVGGDRFDQPDPTAALAKRVMWRLRVGQQLDEALRISLDELLEERPRHLV